MDADDERARHAGGVYAFLYRVETVVRCQREWQRVLRLVADSATHDEAERRLVTDMGFSEIQAGHVGSVQFGLLVEKERTLFATMLEEEYWAIASGPPRQASAVGRRKAKVNLGRSGSDLPSGPRPASAPSDARSHRPRRTSGTPTIESTSRDGGRRTEEVDEREKRARRTYARLRSTETVVRCQREWQDILRHIADSATEEEAERRLVTEMRFNELEAKHVGSIPFYFLLGEQRARFATRLDEVYREIGTPRPE